MFLIDSLPSWIELQQWIYTIQNLASLHDGNGVDEFKALTIMSQDSFTTWRFTPLYKDPAIFSNSPEVLIFLKNMCRQLFLSRTSLDIDQVSEFSILLNIMF